PDAILLIEIDDAIHILDDRSVGRASAQTSRVRAVHALVLAHQPAERAVIALVLGEFDQVVIVPLGGRHRPVGVVEGCLAQWMIVPFHAGTFASLAADAGRHIDQLRYLEFPYRVGARDRSGMAGNCFDPKSVSLHRSSLRSLSLFNLDQES